MNHYVDSKSTIGSVITIFFTYINHASLSIMLSDIAAIVAILAGAATFCYTIYKWANDEKRKRK